MVIQLVNGGLNIIKLCADYFTVVVLSANAKFEALKSKIVKTTVINRFIFYLELESKKAQTVLTVQAFLGVHEY